MQNRLVIIPCGKTKIWDDGITRGPVRAQDAYTGNMFRLGVQYAKSCDADWIILSAKYGYILPDEKIEAYDVTFKKKSSNPISYKELSGQLQRLGLIKYKEIIALGGVEYIKATIDSFACWGRSEISTPFAGLSMGYYQQALKKAIEDKINESVQRQYQEIENEPFHVDENGKITFSRSYWWLPTYEDAFSGWLEGPPPTSSDKKWEYFRIKAERDAWLKIGPTLGAWVQFNKVTFLIGKKLKIQMSGDWCEDPYPMEAFCTGVHLKNDEDSFLRGYMCLKDICNLDTHLGPENGMYDGSCHLIEVSGGVFLLPLANIYELSLIQN